MLMTPWSISRKFSTYTQQSVLPDKIANHPHVYGNDLTVFTFHTFVRNKQAVPHICHDITWEASFAYNGLFESRERAKLSLHCVYASPFWRSAKLFSPYFPCSRTKLLILLHLTPLELSADSSRIIIDCGSRSDGLSSRHRILKTLARDVKGQVQFFSRKMYPARGMIAPRMIRKVWSLWLIRPRDLNNSTRFFSFFHLHLTAGCSWL